MLSNQDILTGLLYTVGDEGIEQLTLCELLDVTADEITELVAHFDSRVMRIQKYGSRYFLGVMPELNPYIDRLVTQEVGRKLTQASMETLAIIAYNQPVTRSDIEAMRGVSSDGPVKTLLDKGLVITKQEETRSQQLYTSDYFLQVFGIESLAELPADSTTEHELEMEQFFKSMNDKGDSYE
ncbi:SMC-Scp complex subunit ScpB [Macrococcus equipercicus]|uniref:SMC-Scp complex subunit ScpB n=1 Tax=Macrococcus equipercicus TaxID=69967 RepID=A0A9Q9BU35_9STAP|nr:SMC-Scp complex subunit ScpB [Macrococcus equipercicus]KAA1040160.1 SMC-Scp complex subunit ScpB [Macrococcus equipercicus]UTH12893.1 SMC-Scp complex subunit ScpB [Macrococcus equipercicus]